MGIKRAIKQGMRVLANPEKEFSQIKKRSFEDILGDYIIFILVAGLLAGIAILIYQFGRVAYLDFFKSITIDYWRLFNYSIGTAISAFFFYLFAGTFIMFIISLIIKPFARGIKYSLLLSIIIYSLSPILIFNWIKESLFPALLVWSLFLLVKGIRTAKEDIKNISKRKNIKRMRA